MFQVPPGITTDTAIHVIEAAALAGLAFIGLKIQKSQAESKVDQLEMKSELVDKLNEASRDMAEKHAENTQAIAVHAGSDEAKFDAISRTLIRMDTKLDQITDRRPRN